MLGYVINTGKGAGDALLAAVAQDLRARGVGIAGVVQTNYVFDPERRCHMDLAVLGRDAVLRISQDRGRHARGCRLDPDGLAQAVAMVERDLDTGAPALLLINKFGKSELDGDGFRDVIAKALMAGVPVLTGVSKGNLAGFLDFAGDLATELPADQARIVAWCMAQATGLAA